MEKSLLESYYCQHIPDYYPGMYRDGFTPAEILYAVRRSMAKQMEQRQEQSQEMPQIKIISEVKIR